ncbi:hypothetical protein OTU49_010182, partial [Cherax quadricarinatus]
QAYVTIHSFGQYILHPWGYTASVIRSNAGRLGTVGTGMAEAILAGEQVTYMVGSPGELLYPASGASDDYAAGVGDIPLVYTLELRDTGAAGFILPKELIRPTINDAWLAIKYLGNHVIQTSLRDSGNEQITATNSAEEESVVTIEPDASPAVMGEAVLVEREETTEAA